jgi:hypothetical protein
MGKLSLDYIAGLIDADGSISIGVSKTRYPTSKVPRSEMSRVQISFNINLRQVPQYRYILEDVKETLGLGSIYESKATSPTATTMTSWQSTKHSETMEACRVLQPYLKIKQKEANLMIAALTLWEENKGIGQGSGYSHPDWVKKQVIEISSLMNPSQQKETSRRNKEIRNKGVQIEIYS